MKPRELLVIGAGGHGKVVADAAISAGWSVAGFLDDQVPTGTLIIGIPVLGNIETIHARKPEQFQAVIAIGDATARIAWVRKCAASGLLAPALVHPSAAVSRHASLGAGTVVLAQSAINAGALVGMGVIINTGATVDHDCVVGDGVHICPGTHLGGHVDVGAASWIGIGSSVRHGIRIGANVTVGAGSVVVKDIDDGQTVVGVRATARVPK